MAELIQNQKNLRGRKGLQRQHGELIKVKGGGSMKLDAVNQIRRELEAAEEKLCSLRECVGAVSVPKLDGLPKAKPQSSPVERIAQKIFEAEASVENLRLKLSETAADLTEEIYRRVTSPRARHVLIRRYVLGWQWKTIYTDLMVSEGDTFYWRRIGIKEFNSAA